jgi:hypothetical protein
MTRTLDPAVYWKLRAICTDTRLAQEAFVAAQRKQVALLTELGFDPQTPNLALNDDTLTVACPDAEVAPA